MEKPSVPLGIQKVSLLEIGKELRDEMVGVTKTKLTKNESPGA